MQCADAGLRAVYHLNLYTQWGALLFEKFRIVEDLKSETFEETTQHLPYPVDTNRDFYAREWGQYIVESKSSTF